MVFQKKGGAAAKNAQVKKKGKPVFEQVEDDDLDMLDMEDMDDDDFGDSGSEEELPVQKTPKSKTPKGKQTPNEKKVSFQIPGKNTPAKTPNKNNSLLAQKQPTPGNKGKTAVQEFKGMKGKKNQAKPDDDDDDDDDDDEEDDDDEDDLDLDLGGEDEDEDDDDDDDDEEEEDEDDDDDDDEEDEDATAKANIQKQLSALKQKSKGQTNQKTPTKAAEKSKNAETPKGNVQNNKEKKSAIKTLEEMPSELQRRRERDSKMLYLGNLPKDATPAELKTLSSDIVDVVMPFLKSNRSRDTKMTYAFLLFNSEKKAEENYKSLQSKKFRGQLFNLDFVGEKSKNKKPKDTSSVPEQKQYNMKKLFISGMPKDATIDQIAKFFPKSYQITLTISPEYRAANVNFVTEEDATEAFESSKDIDINGHKLIVLHSVVTKQGNRKHYRKRPFGGKNKGQGGTPNKRQRKNPKTE